MVELCTRKAAGGRVQSNVVKALETEKGYWRRLIERIVNVLQLQCLRALAFCDEDEHIGSPSNGNYLEILELLSSCDTFLAEHIFKQANKARGHTSYLCSIIFEGLIELMGLKCSL